MFVLAVGDAFDGVLLFVKDNKPFMNQEDAKNFGDANFESYKIIPLYSSQTLAENEQHEITFEEDEDEITFEEEENQILSLCL